MAFQIGKQISLDDATVVDVHYDPKGRFVRPDDVQEDTEMVSFHIVPLTGKTQREISDKMMSVSKKGKTEMRTGTAEMIRVIRSVVSIDGLETPQGRKLTKMTEDVYDACPRWMLDALLEEIHILNGTNNVMGEDGPEDADSPFDES